MVRPDAGLAIVMGGLILASMGAGCLGETEPTAKRQEPVADERATAWSEDARLVQVVGVEGSHGAAAGFASGERMPDPSYWEGDRVDEDPGDGVAPLWVYRYIDPEENGSMLEVAVDAEEGVVEEQILEAPGAFEPVGNWSIDSDAAVETALEENDALSKASSKETFGLVVVLQAGDDGQTAWLVAGGGGDQEEGGGGLVEISAGSGEILDSRGAFGS